MLPFEHQKLFADRLPFEHQKLIAERLPSNTEHQKLIAERLYNECNYHYFIKHPNEILIDDNTCIKPCFIFSLDIKHEIIQLYNELYTNLRLGIVESIFYLDDTNIICLLINTRIPLKVSYQSFFDRDHIMLFFNIYGKNQLVTLINQKQVIFDEFINGISIEQIYSVHKCYHHNMNYIGVHPSGAFGKGSITPILFHNDDPKCNLKAKYDMLMLMGFEMYSILYIDSYNIICVLTDDKNISNIVNFLISMKHKLYHLNSVKKMKQLKNTIIDAKYENTTKTKIDVLPQLKQVNITSPSENITSYHLNDVQKYVDNNPNDVCYYLVIHNVNKSFSINNNVKYVYHMDIFTLILFEKEEYIDQIKSDFYNIVIDVDYIYPGLFYDKYLEIQSKLEIIKETIYEKEREISRNKKILDLEEINANKLHRKLVYDIDEGLLSINNLSDLLFKKIKKSDHKYFLIDISFNVEYIVDKIVKYIMKNIIINNQPIICNQYYYYIQVIIHLMNQTVYKKKELKQLYNSYNTIYNNTINDDHKYMVSNFLKLDQKIRYSISNNNDIHTDIINDCSVYNYIKSQQNITNTFNFFKSIQSKPNNVITNNFNTSNLEYLNEIYFEQCLELIMCKKHYLGLSDILPNDILSVIIGKMILLTSKDPPF